MSAKGATVTSPYTASPEQEKSLKGCLAQEMKAKESNFPQKYSL